MLLACFPPANVSAAVVLLQTLAQLKKAILSNTFNQPPIQKKQELVSH